LLFYTLNDESGLVFCQVEDSFGTACVVASVQLGRLGDGQRRVLRLDEPRLLLEIDQLIGVQPLDRQVERRVRNGIATESGRLSSSHFVVFGSVPDDSSL
jgi:hypothetical protein